MVNNIKLNRMCWKEMLNSHMLFLYYYFLYTTRGILKTCPAKYALSKTREKDWPQFSLPYIYISTPSSWLPSINLMHTMTFQICPHWFPQPDPVTKQANPNLPHKSQVPEERIIT